MKLTEHFTLEEFVQSDTAVRMCIDNTPPDHVIKNLKILAVALESVRDILGKPIIITSGYRCGQLNACVGGSLTSAHMHGYAADFKVPGMTTLEVCKAIMSSAIMFDQVIQEGGGWVHLSIDPRLRMECLTATFHPDGPHYTSGFC